MLNAPFENCLADYLILNTMQLALFCDLIANVEDISYLAYVISITLPPVTSQDSWSITETIVSLNPLKGLNLAAY